MKVVPDDEEEETVVAAPAPKIIASKKGKYADEDASDEDLKVSETSLTKQLCRFRSRMRYSLWGMLTRTIGMRQTMKRHWRRKQPLPNLQDLPHPSERKESRNKRLQKRKRQN